MKTLSFASAAVLAFAATALADEVDVAVDADPDTEVEVYEFEYGTDPAYDAWGHDAGMLTADELVVDPETEIVEPDPGLPPDFEPDAVFHIWVDEETGARTVTPMEID